MVFKLKNTNSVTVKLEYGKLDEVFQWCNSHCNGDWNIEKITEYAGYHPGTYEFIFDLESDAVMFSLKWL